MPKPPMALRWSPAQRNAAASRQIGDKSVYGSIATTVFNDSSGPLVPPGTVDFVLTARNLHDWMDTREWWKSRWLIFTPL